MSSVSGSAKATSGNTKTTEPTTSVYQSVTASWWLPLVRGLALVLFGLLLLIEPLTRTLEAVDVMFDRRS